MQAYHRDRQGGGQGHSCGLERYSSYNSAPFNIITTVNKQSCFPGQTVSDRKQEGTIIVSTEITQTGRVLVIVFLCVCATLQVRDRVQGRLVSGSWTPQCLLGSNTLPVNTQTHTHKLDWY